MLYAFIDAFRLATGYQRQKGKFVSNFSITNMQKFLQRLATVRNTTIGVCQNFCTIARPLGVSCYFQTWSQYDVQQGFLFVIFMVYQFCLSNNIHMSRGLFQINEYKPENIFIQNILLNDFFLFISYYFFASSKTLHLEFVDRYYWCQLSLKQVGYYNSG